MPWSIAWPTARLASCTSMLPYIVVLISQVPKPIAEQIRSVLPKRRCSIISLPIFLRTNRNRKQTKRGQWQFKGGRQHECLYYSPLHPDLSKYQARRGGLGGRGSGQLDGHR